MPVLLVVHHTPSPALQELLEAVRAGAGHEELGEVEVVTRPALSATPPTCWPPTASSSARRPTSAT